MKVILPLIAVGILMAIGFIGSFLPPVIFTGIVPYIALVLFIGGVIWRVLGWARSPVPFRIPTTSGQQKSLPWVKRNRFDNPFTTSETVTRMAGEVLLFRSLFKNTRTELKHDRNLTYGQEVWLWAGALAFHYAFLVVFLRHFRFFLEPVPFFVGWIEAFDGFFEVGVPVVMLSGFVLLAAVGYLFFRRLYYSNVRYISLASDYFPLFLIMAIAATGILMRHIGPFRVDLFEIKRVAHGIFAFHPYVPGPESSIGFMFYIHLFLVSTLIAYFPFSKLAHAPGIFMSPTRNLANNSRAKRHINPWNPEVKLHTYQEWEEEFYDLLKDAGMPIDNKRPETKEEKKD